MNRRALLVGGASVAALPLTIASTAFVPERLFVRDFIGTQRGLDYLKATFEQLPPGFITAQVKAGATAIIEQQSETPYAA